MGFVFLFSYLKRLTYVSCTVLLVLSIFLASLAGSSEAETRSKGEGSGSEGLINAVEHASILVDLDCDAIAQIRVGKDIEGVFTSSNLRLYNSTDHTDFSPKDFIFKCGGKVGKLPLKLSKWGSNIPVRNFIKSASKFGFQRKTFANEIRNKRFNSARFKFDTKLLITVGVTKDLHRSLSTLIKKSNQLDKELEDRIECSINSSNAPTVKDFVEFFKDMSLLRTNKGQIAYVLGAFRDGQTALKQLAVLIRSSDLPMAFQKEFYDTLKHLKVLEKTIVEFMISSRQIQLVLDKFISAGSSSKLREAVSVAEERWIKYSLNAQIIDKVAKESGIDPKEVRVLAEAGFCRLERELQVIVGLSREFGEEILKYNHLLTNAKKFSDSN